MGYPEISKFDKVFLKRTLDNLELMESCQNNFTFLVNSMLGLLILPNEYLEKKKYSNTSVFSKKLKECKEIIKIFSSNEITIMQDREYTIQKCIFRTNKNEEKDANNVTLMELLKKMRNSFAHFNIEPTKMGNDWHGIILKNRNKDGYNTFELYMEKHELKIFVEYIIKCNIAIDN
jgi:hypothetical protein